jgi:hypothetical protein
VIVIRFHPRVWGLVWAPADACRVMGWRWALQVGPFSIIRKV